VVIGTTDNQIRTRVNKKRSIRAVLRGTVAGDSARNFCGNPD
jgi:hypothetical protein